MASLNKWAKDALTAQSDNPASAARSTSPWCWVRITRLWLARSLCMPRGCLRADRMRAQAWVMREVTLILAMAENGVIGKDGAIPWHISDDLKRFKALTLGKRIVMGRKTWDSLPRKPLPGRDNIVVTRDASWRAEGAIAVTGLEQALTDAAMVIGGAEIYRAALPSASRIELTEVHRAFDSDARFEFDRSGWKEVTRERHASPDGLEYSYVTLTRK